MRVQAVATAALLGLGVACSFTTATGFTDCTSDVQCGASGACSRGYCLPIPPLCRRFDQAPFERSDTLRLAALLPLTDSPDGGGITDDTETQSLNALGLALRDVNSQGGLGGRRFGLYVCNTGNSDDVLVSQLRWATTQLEIPAVFTSGSNQTVAAAEDPVRLDAGTLVVSATSTSPRLVGVFQRDRSTYRIAPSDALQVAVLMQILTTDPQYAAQNRVAVVYERGNYGQGIATPMAERLIAAGRVARTIEHTTPIAAANVVSQMADFKPNATVVASRASDARTLVTGAATNPLVNRASGHRWLFTDNGKDPAIIDAATVPELDGALGTAPAQGAGVAFNDFRDRFLSNYGVDPSSYSFTSHSYDGMFAMMFAAAYAARDGGSVTGPRMAEGMARLSTDGGLSVRIGPLGWADGAAQLLRGSGIDIEGASGKLDFDPDAGAPSAPYEVWQVRDGGITTVRFITP